MNEWAFAAEVKTWWDQEFANHPEWKMTRCQVEEQAEGDRRRSDLTIKGTANQVVAAGELRLPDHPQASPYDPENLLGAINKALELRAEWAFTSDCNRLLLIRVSRSGRPQERIVDRADMVEFELRTQLDDSGFLSRVRVAWVAALQQIAPVIAGIEDPAGMALDEVFIESLRALLVAPVSAVRTGLDVRRQTDPRFADELVVWMVDEQGWVHDPSMWSAETLRTAQLSAYVFTTRLMFYEALRRSQPGLESLMLPASVSARVAHGMFRTWFDIAKEQSGDYRTLFDWDKANEFALCSDDTVPGWSRVLAHLASFDLSTLGFDIVGRVFERLIEPTERYRWGQHYTQPDVVDLMMAFALADGTGAVLDPAVGGGTFLVRAYERKAARQPQSTHQQRLAEMYGVDVSSFAATLATINLAARRLEFEDNYPQVVARSFFRVQPGGRFMTLPAVQLNSGLFDVAIEKVAAVVCNPPYVRRQQLGEERLIEARGVLGRTAGMVPTPRGMNKNANYHVYFWLHAAQFLAPGGRLAFITSGEWYDSDYGVALQQWLLNGFCIEAVIESNAEPWFSPNPPIQFGRPPWRPASEVAWGKTARRGSNTSSGR